MTGEMTYFGGDNMLDMHFISEKAMYKYNLEKKIDENGCDDGAYFIRLIDSEWWILGIDEEENLLYAQYDGDGIFHSINTCGINDLEDNDYVLVGCCTKYVPGIISTRSISDPIADAKDFIQSGTVYRIKYVGPDISI